MSVKVMGAVWELDLTAAKRLVLLAMADHADHDGRNVYPSVGLVAWKTGYSKRQVQRIIAELVTDRLLEKQKGVSSVGTSIYRIVTLNGTQKAAFRGDKMSPPKMSPQPSSDKMSPPPRHFDAPTSVKMSPDPSVLEPSDKTNTSISNEMEHHADPPSQNYDMVSDHIPDSDKMVTPSKQDKPQLPKVPTKGIFPPSVAVKDAFAVYCYRNPQAWHTNATVMMRALNTIAKAEGRLITVDDLRGHYSWWKANDWRGKKGEMPKPYQVTETWAAYQASLDPDAPTLGTGKPPPKSGDEQALEDAQRWAASLSVPLPAGVDLMEAYADSIFGPKVGAR